MSQPRQDDRQFRRGVVLGLTFAEILLLLIFLLMLVLASHMKVLNRHLDEERTRRIAVEQQVAALQPLFEKIKSAGEAFDITREWVKVHEELARAEAEIAASKDVVALAARRRATEPGLSNEEIARKIEGESQLGRRFMADARALEPSLPQAQALDAYEADASTGKMTLDKSGANRNLLADASSCHASLSTCKAQNSNLSARLGGVLPPCWVDASGKTQYIFDARLREDGIWLTDNHVAGREGDPALPLISGFQFGVPLNINQLDQAGTPLLAYSERNGCRFYVRVFDETDAASKARYKELLRGVEGIFYKLLVA
jgi:hypothetical protein